MAEGAVVNTCGICLSGFQDPKILPCFHTFCTKCLENNLATTRQQYSFKCPMCRTVTRIPDGGVKSFQTNFYVKTNDVFKSDLDCDGCCQQQKACRKCSECCQNFCEQCSAVHTRTSATKHHHLHDIVCKSAHQRRETQYCQSHLCEYVSVCKECHVFCCSECTITTHKHHSLASIESAASEKRLVLEELIDQSKQCTQEIENDACAMRRQNNAKFLFFRNEIEHLRNQKNALVEKINDAFLQFEHSTNEINVDQRTKADELTEKQLAECELQRETINKSKAVLDSGNDIDLLTAFEELSTNLSTSESKLTPCVPGHKLMENVEKCTSWLVQINEVCKGVSWQDSS